MKLSLTLLRSRRGVTMVEIMVATVIASGVTVSVMALLLCGVDGWNRGTSKAYAETSSTIAAQKIAREIRDGQSFSITIDRKKLTVTLPYETVDVNKESCYNRGIAGQVREYYVPTGTTTLKRKVNGVESTVLERVNGIDFTANGPRITITVTGKEQVGTFAGQDRSSNASVRLRNYKI